MRVRDVESSILRPGALWLVAGLLLAVGPRGVRAQDFPARDTTGARHSPEASGRLTVETQPAGAQVLVDRNLVGQTPLRSYTLPADAYRLSLRHEGYAPVDTVVAIWRDSDVRVDFRLRRADGPPARSSADEAAAAEGPPVTTVSYRDIVARDEQRRNAARTGADAQQENGSSPQAASVQAASVQERGAVLSQAEREAFDRYLALGNEMFLQERYQEARIAYEQALQVQPGDARALRRVERVETIIKEAEQARLQYSYHRGRGDVHFERGDYEAALESYGEALEYRPEDDYLQERLVRSRALLDAHAEEAAAQRREEALAARRTDDGVYLLADTPPHLVGGLEALHQKVVYPRRAVRQEVEGRVVVQMVVTSDGRARDVEVVRGIGGGCDEEALRVVREARFEPAMVDGEAVPARHYLWVLFQITDEEEGAATP